MNEYPDQPSHPDDGTDPPMVRPARGPSRINRPAPPPKAPAASGAGAGRLFLVLVLLGSLAINLLLFLVVVMRSSGSSDDDGVPIIEKHWGGTQDSTNKIAIVRAEGVLLEETPGHSYILRQIDHAAKDKNVKGIVLRVNSPGGSVTSAEEIHKRLTEMKNGSSPRFKSDPKKLVTSMGGMATSGGYYIAMPSEHIFAEPITITGSIGVYMSMPNVQKLANDNGVKMTLIKAGDVKAGGSMFHELTPQERQQFQDSVEVMYSRFVKIVEDGRPHLKGQLTKDLVRKDADGNPIKDETYPRDDKGNLVEGGKPLPYKRKLADGGIFMSGEAKIQRLIDDIGYVEDAAKHAASLASLSDYEIVQYDRPITFMSLFGLGSTKSVGPDWTKLAASASPRMWYLAPNNEFAALFAAMGQQ